MMVKQAMTDEAAMADVPAMTVERAQALVVRVAREGLSESRVSSLERLWEALGCLDAAAIEERAALWLAELDRAEFEAEFPEAEERRERGEMLAFYASVLDYWMDQSEEVYPAVGHDIDNFDNWLGGHAEVLAAIRWGQIEALLNQAGDAAGRLVLQSWINLQQQAARMDVEQRALWAGIAARVEAALGLAGVVA